MSMIDGEFPLRWVLGKPRTPADKRKHAIFGVHGETGRQPVSISVSLDRLGSQLRMFGATHVVLSSNIPLTLQGIPSNARTQEPTDPGAAVYFRLKDKAHGIACDKWNRVADNITAISKHVWALKGMDHWGCGDVAQVLAGFKLLTAMEERKSWWQILGFKEPPPVFSTVERAWEKLIRDNHPDKGGSNNQAAEINAALQEANVFYEKAP